MHGDFFLLEGRDGSSRKACRLPLGDTRGRNEAWLRDTLFANPELLPIADIEPAYGPLLPLCRELRTAAGPIDIAFINPVGRLTLVECKLWRNAEARRKVVAQVLDYARAIKTWSYADLQRQTSMATGLHGNVPFEVARAQQADLEEHRFIDHVSRAMRQGRFLLLVAGDGIREDVGGIADLINRNAASGFSFGLVEVALYEFPDGALVVQPRSITRTLLIERHIVVVADEHGSSVMDKDHHEDGELEDEGSTAKEAIREAETAWWLPVTSMHFDDPEQDPPFYRWRNHVRAELPVPGLWLSAYLPRAGANVSMSGQRNVRRDVLRALMDDDTLFADLPGEAKFTPDSTGETYLNANRPASAFTNDDEKRAWICKSLNQFANALRPRLKVMTEPR